MKKYAIIMVCLIFSSIVGNERVKDPAELRDLAVAAKATWTRGILRDTGTRPRWPRQGRAAPHWRIESDFLFRNDRDSGRLRGLTTNRLPLLVIVHVRDSCAS